MHSEITRLRKENAALKTRLAEAQARADSTGRHQVHIVPQGISQDTATEHLRGGVKPGDKIRFADSGRELTFTEDGWMTTME
jgi:hydroxymethylpyrimidine pyrophosphatase-like HAD family hydrolase